MLKPPEAVEEMSESPFKGKKGLVRVIHAFFNSVAGLQDAWRNESAFRQEVLLAAILIPIACLVHGNRAVPGEERRQQACVRRI